MLAVLYLLGIGILAYQLQNRFGLLASFRGWPRYLSALGLTLFLVNWTNFLLYVAVGWGGFYQRSSWGLLIVAVFYFSDVWRSHAGPRPDGLRPSELWHRLTPRQWNLCFLFLAVFVFTRFYAGLDVDEETNVWTTFNFVDTAFHLSVANAFLAAPHFPPMDLDMAPYPLKYHFLADFNVAHLVRLGLPPLSAMWLMNLISALVLVGALWATFERWLKLPPRWVMLAGLIFLFLNNALLNLIHFVALRPQFLDPGNPFYGLLRFPYFNFESALSNMLEPQRGLLFSMPIVLLVLHAAFGQEEDPAGAPANPARVTIEAFILVCLLPLSHIVAFGVLAPCLVPKLWQYWRPFFARTLVWFPVFVVGVLQLLYLAFYGPPANAAFSSWSATTFLPLQDFAVFPVFLRVFAFWFFANGDFLFWGLFFAAIAFARRNAAAAAGSPSVDLWGFLRRWGWFFGVCGFYFLLINFYRYSFDWGDSNKLVFFLNLGLTLVIVQGAAQWTGPRRYWSHALWLFFFLLCVAPPSYSFYLNVLKPGRGEGTVLLFEKNGRLAAEWVRRSLQPTDVVLTAAYNTMHFVTPLAGQPTLAGIYGDSNPYRQDDRGEKIRRVYEQGELGLLPELGIRYVCVSRNERRKYQLDRSWTDRMEHDTGVVFEVGGGPEDYHSVYIFDVQKFAAP